MKKIFDGVCCAIVTPFCCGKVDYKSFGKLIDMQVGAKVSAIVVLGTTGESACISHSERKRIITFCINRVAGMCKVIVGTGSNCTDVAIKLTLQAENLGADAALIVTPYYNKCTQNGLIKHYKSIASKTKLPIIIYNVPSRTGVNILPKTAAELAKIKNIVGLKEANSDLTHINNMLKILNKRLPVYCGNDELNYYFLTHGGMGIISVVVNAYPKLLVDFYNNIKCGNYIDAYNVQNKLKNFNSLLFSEVNPIGIKFCLSNLGLCENELRLPLTPLSKSNAIKLEKEMKKIKI